MTLYQKSSRELANLILANAVLLSLFLFETNAKKLFLNKLACTFLDVNYQKTAPGFPEPFYDSFYVIPNDQFFTQRTTEV